MRTGVTRPARILAESKAEAEKLQADFAIVVFPSTLQINSSHLSFFEAAGLSTHQETLTERVVQDRIEDLAGNLDLPVLDMLPGFRARREVGSFQDYNIHFSMAGNTFAADTIDSFASGFISVGE